MYPKISSLDRKETKNNNNYNIKNNNTELYFLN